MHQHFPRAESFSSKKEIIACKAVTPVSMRDSKKRRTQRWHLIHALVSKSAQAGMGVCASSPLLTDD